MATIVASNIAANGYPVGNDSTGNGSAATPYLTLSKALSVWAHGDTIIMNGSETASASNPQGLDYFNIARAGTIQAAVRGAFTLQATGVQSRVLNYATAAASGKTKVDGFIIDARATQTSCITSNSGADATTVNCTLTNPAGNQHYQDTSATGDVSMDSIVLAGSSAVMIGGIYISNIGATKKVILNNISGSVTGITVSKGGAINLIGSATGAYARVENCNGLSATSNGGGQVAPIHFQGVTGLIQNNRDLRVNEVSANTSSGLILVTPIAGVQADKGAMIGNSGTNNCSGGYLQRVGTDASAATDNLTNNWESAGNTYFANPNASVLHGVMFGNCVGGRSDYDTVWYAGISFLSKQQSTGAVFKKGKAELPKPASAVLYAKGSTGPQFIGMDIRLPDSFTGNYILRSDFGDNGTTPSSVVFDGCNISSSSGNPVPLVATVPSTNTAAFRNNNYNFAVSGTPWNYQGTAYATLAAWTAALEPTARNVSPTSLNLSFHKNAYAQRAKALMVRMIPHLANHLDL